MNVRREQPLLSIGRVDDAPALPGQIAGGVAGARSEPVGFIEVMQQIHALAHVGAGKKT